MRRTIRRTTVLLTVSGAFALAMLTTGCEDVQPGSVANLSTPGPPLPSVPTSPPATPKPLAPESAPSSTFPPS